MNNYEKGIKILEKRCGNNKDNIISLATISTNLSYDGQPIPAVRNVDAYYEDGAFYIVTYGKSNKMIEIGQNKNVAFSVNSQNISGTGVADNLGWVLDPKNEVIRTKLRQVFAKWYDEANNEADENFCYTAIRIANATVVTGHGPTTKKYYLDLINQKEMDEIKEMKDRDAYYVTFNGEDAIEKGREYIFKFLAENHIDMAKEEQPIYIFGKYDLMKTSDIDFEYTLYAIVPDTIKLKSKLLNTRVFGGLYARRYTIFEEAQSSALDLYHSFENHSAYQVDDSFIIEQYLLDKNKFSKNTQVLQILPLKVK